MSDTLTIKINDKKARRLLKTLEEIKLISIIHDTNINSIIRETDIKWTSKKKKQAKDFLSALKQAKLAEEGKIKLKTAQSLIDEL